jgi:hypothetical protein
MRGFTLLEILVATLLFLVILIVGHEAARLEKDLILATRAATAPEKECDYRLIVLKHFLEGSSETFKSDKFLEPVPTFFNDLNFGQSPRTDAFSVTIADGSPQRFVRDGSLYRMFVSLKVGDMLLLGGLTESNHFGWNYAQIRQVQGDLVEMNFFLPHETLDKGAWIKIEMHGFLFKQETLYWISPAGQVAPFLSPLNDFHFSWVQPQLTISWRSGLSDLEFQSTL